jgi:hypothetical protein
MRRDPLGDLNGDGKPDIVTANNDAGTVSVLLNATTPGASTPSFGGRNDLVAGDGPTGVALGDLNGDGRPDIVASNVLEDTLSVFLNTTTGSAPPTFRANVDLSMGGFPEAVVLADLDGDGRPDIITANPGGDSVSVRVNTTASGATIPAFGSEITFAVARTPRDLAVGDLNGDGRPDIVTTSQADDEVSVLISDSLPGAAPHFRAHSDVAVGADPHVLAIGDLNGDGRADVIAANHNGNTVSILLSTTNPGDTNPTFRAQGQFSVGINPYSIALADLNGDGRLDVVAGNLADESVSVLLNRMAPGATLADFETETHVAGGGEARGMALADLNGDGRPDVVMANGNDANVGVLLNNTAPGATAASFLTLATFARAGAPTGVALVDLNGDGRLDVVTANFGGNVGIQLNTTPPGATTPTFAPELTFPAASPDELLALADLNGDGRLDIVTANTSSNSVSVLLRSLAFGTLQFSATGASVDESNLGVTFFVQRTGGGDSAVMAILGVGGTASVPGDAAVPASVFFDNNDSGPKPVQIDLVDDTIADSGETVIVSLNTATGGAALGAQTSYTLTITDTDAPVLTASGGGISYTEDQPPTAIDANLTVADADSANLSGATVQLTAGYQNGQDVLACPACPGQSITASFTVATGTLTLSGSAAPGAYQTALRSVTYQNSSESPATAARTASYQVADAPSSNHSNVGTRGITVAAVNDAPVAVGDDYVVTAGTIATIPAPGVLANDIDPDGPTLTAVKVSEPAHGAVTLQPNGGFTYTPAAGYGGPDSFTYKPNDTQADGNVVTVSLTVGGPGLTIGDARVVEGDAGTKTATFTVSLTPANANPVTVQVRTQDGSATAGSDYVALPPTTLTFAPGETSKTVGVTISGDTTQESDETFTVALSDPTGASISRATATGYIVNDDSPNPRAQVGVQQVVNGTTPTPGRLQVTLRADTSVCPAGNTLQRIDVGAARNARVEVPGAAPGAPGGPSETPGGPNGTPGNFTLTVGAPSVTFFVQRQAPGDFKVDLAIVDTCTASAVPFRTFVGGGVGVP